MEFGYRDISMEKKRSEYRYCRGSTHGALFARGYYGDGTVCVWDYRQPKVCFLLVYLISGTYSYSCLTQNIVKRFERRREAAITHTVVSGDQVIAYGGNCVTFWDMDIQSL